MNFFKKKEFLSLIMQILIFNFLLFDNTHTNFNHCYNKKYLWKHMST